MRLLDLRGVEASEMDGRDRLTGSPYRRRRWRSGRGGGLCEGCCSLAGKRRNWLLSGDGSRA